MILQVGYFKATGGKRLFRMAPLHHHFELIGWSEPKVITRFVIVAIIFRAFLPGDAEAAVRNDGTQGFSRAEHADMDCERGFRRD